MSHISRSREIAVMLQKAKSALEAHGWQQGGDFTDNVGRLSLDGALNFATTGNAGMPSIGSGVIESAVLDILIARDYDGVVADWNDYPGRTVAEVYALLDEAIANVGHEGQAS